MHEQSDWTDRAREAYEIVLERAKWRIRDRSGQDELVSYAGVEITRWYKRDGAAAPPPPEVVAEHVLRQALARYLARRERDGLVDDLDRPVGEDGDTLGDLVPGARGVDANVIAAEAGRRYVENVRRLEDRAPGRAARYAARVFDDVSPEAIAEEWGMTRAAVSTEVRRTHVHLREGAEDVVPLRRPPAGGPAATADGREAEAAEAIRAAEPVVRQIHAILGCSRAYLGDGGPDWQVVAAYLQQFGFGSLGSQRTRTIYRDFVTALAPMVRRHAWPQPRPVPPRRID